MAKQEISIEEIIRNLKNRQYAPIYYLMGDESYYIDKIADYMADTILTPEEREFNQMIFYGGDTDIETIINAAKRFPMMAERQVVWVREAQNLPGKERLSLYLEHPQPTTVLILCHKHGVLDRRKKLAADIQKVGILFESKKMYDSQLPGFVVSYMRRKGVAMEQQAVMMVCEFVGSDLSRLAGELDKLILALPEGEKRIGAAFVETHIGISKDFNNFELVSALVEKDVLKVNRIVKYFNDNPKNFSLQLTLTVMFGFFSNVMLAYYAPLRTEEGIADWIGQPRWQVSRNIFPAMHKYSGVKVMQIIGKIREMDAKSKGVGNTIATPGELLKELAYFILH